MDVVVILLVPVALFGFGTLMRYRGKLDWGEDVGLRAPRALPAVGWIAGFVVYAAAAELLGNALGINEAGGSWIGKYDTAQLALRIAAVGLLYPLAEEFFFRGAFLGMMRRRFGTAAAVVAASLLFAGLHIQYAWLPMLFILADALFFAGARLATGSVYVPMACHVLGNGYAVWERLSG